jgi:hypothetical protein
MAVSGGFRRWFIVQSTGWNDDSLAIARCMRHGAIAAGTNLSCKAFCLRQVVTRYQFLSLEPTKLIDGNGNVGCPNAAGCFPTARTIAVGKSHEWRFHLIANCFAKTTSMELLVRHRNLLIACRWSGFYRSEDYLDSPSFAIVSRPTVIASEQPTFCANKTSPQRITRQRSRKFFFVGQVKAQRRQRNVTLLDRPAVCPLFGSFDRDHTEPEVLAS